MPVKCVSALTVHCPPLYFSYTLDVTDSLREKKKKSAQPFYNLKSDVVVKCVYL